MKVLFYDRWKNKQMANITCDDCGAGIGTEGYYEEVLDIKHRGMNHGKHECFVCKKRRERAYDDHVDPLRQYH